MDLSERAPERIAVEIGPHGLGQATTLWPDSRLVEGDEVEYVRADLQRGAVSAADVVAWLRSSEWDGDATWEHYARAIALDIEKSVEKGRIPSSTNPGAVDPSDDLFNVLARVIENRHGTLHGIGSTLREAFAEYEQSGVTR